MSRDLTESFEIIKEASTKIKAEMPSCILLLVTCRLLQAPPSEYLEYEECPYNGNSGLNTLECFSDCV